jgi:hypothetical protein
MKEKVTRTIFLLFCLSRAFSQQIGASAAIPLNGAYPNGLYTIEGSWSYGTHGEWLNSGSVSLITVNAGARLDPNNINDTRIFTELVYWNAFCMGVGASLGPASGKASFNL